jgi:hypothetical protein
MDLERVPATTRSKVRDRVRIRPKPPRTEKDAFPWNDHTLATPKWVVSAGLPPFESGVRQPSCYDLTRTSLEQPIPRPPRTPPELGCVHIKKPTTKKRKREGGEDFTLTKPGIEHAGPRYLTDFERVRLLSEYAMAICQGAPTRGMETCRNPYWYALQQDQRDGIGATCERTHPDFSKTRFHTSTVYSSRDEYANAVILPRLNDWYMQVRHRAS